MSRDGHLGCARYCSQLLITDMIVLLIMAVFILAAFAGWEWWIERRSRTPPLLPLGVFTLDHGRVLILCLVAVSSFAGARETGAHTDLDDFGRGSAVQLRRLFWVYALDDSLLSRIPRTLPQGYGCESI